MAFNRHFQDVTSNSTRSGRFEPYGRNNPGRPSTNLQDRLLGHAGPSAQFNARDKRPSPMDAKDRITSTLKSLGIYKGETEDSSFNYRNPSKKGNEGQNPSLDLPLWDISILKQSKSGRNSTRWHPPEESSYDPHSSTQQPSSFSGPNQRDHVVNPGANQPGHQPQSEHASQYDQGGNQYPTNFGSHNYGPSHAQNQAVPNYSAQSQQQGSGSSQDIPYNGPTHLPHYGNSGEGDAQRTNSEAKGMWGPTQSFTPQSQAHVSMSSEGNTQAWPGQINQIVQPTFNQSGSQNQGNQQPLFPVISQPFGNSGSNPVNFKSSGGGLFDIAKRATYNKSMNSNLKPLVEVTISNPAAMNKNQSQNVRRDPPKQAPGGNVTRGESVKSGGKRKADAQESLNSNKVYTDYNNPKSPEQVALKKFRKEEIVILPAKNASQRFKDDPEKMQLVEKIAQGSQGHQMELFRLIGIKENFALKFLIPWKCYVCGAPCKTWVDYLSHCTGKNHRNTVHSLGTDKGSVARKELKEILLNLPLIPDALCKSLASSEGTRYEGEPDENQEQESKIHACKACGKFYLKVDGLKRHKETEEHKERVEFLEERFGESWHQFQWYNQASQSAGQNTEEPVGVAFIVPISGFFCKLCSQFYNSEVKAKDVHCRQKNHIQKVKEWDRTSKGSMAALPVDLVEIAEAVRQNDKASSPSASKEPSQKPSRSRSRSKSRHDSRASSRTRDKDRDKSSSRRSASKTDKNGVDSQKSKHSSSSEVKIPGLDLGTLSEDVVVVSDYSDVSEEENFSSDKSGKNETYRRTYKEKGKYSDGGKKRSKGGDSLEEGELSVSEVRQLEKDQEKERIVKEWESRERARHWKQMVEREEDERKEQRKKERDQRRQRDYLESGHKDKGRQDRDKERREKEEKERKEKELKEKFEKQWLEKEKQEKEALEKERREKEQLQKEKERLQKEKEQLEKEREEKERQENERLERERLELEERERVANERLEKKRLEQEQREKERQVKEQMEKERLEKEAKEKERLEAERKEKEKKEQERMEKIRLEQERQIREERRRLQHAKEQLERTRRLQEQREKEFKENQMRERSLLEKRIWEQQMREKELLEQQLRQQQLIEQQQLELAREGKRMSEKERQKMERELEEQHLRKRELKERELQEQQEQEFRRLQESQQKEQESRHREMREREQKETELREEEQRQIDEQWRALRAREMRAEELHRANLQEQEIRDRQIREQGLIEWQRREEAMRQDGVPEREIMIRREMFDRELNEMAMRDAEIRAQQLGEVLHDPRGEVDLREKVIQQQQMRERRERILQELRERAHQELERKEMEMRREGFPIAEIEEVIITERQVMEGQILEELRLRGLTGPEFENEERRPQETGEDLLPSHDRRRDRSRSRGDREHSREREKDFREDDYRLHRSRERDEGDERRKRQEFSRPRSEEDERHRFGARDRQEVAMSEEEMLRRQRHEEPGTSMGDLVVHERGGFRNVQIVDKEARLSPHPVEFSRERDRRTSRETGPHEGDEVRRDVTGGRDMRATRGRRGRQINNRGRGRGRRGRGR